MQAQAVSSCLHSSGSGQVQDCPALMKSFDAEAKNNCPIQPAWVKEQISGPFSALPGCDPPTFGPANVVQQNCPGQLVTPTGTFQPRSIPTPGKTNITLSGGQQAIYVGYMADGVSGRALSGTMYSDGSKMTNEACGICCQSKGFSVFGTEYSAECFCGNSINSPTYAQADCGMTCNGNIATWCCGSNRLSVWNLTSSNTAPSPIPSTTTTTTSTPSPTGLTVANATYLGCYTDSVNSKALTGFYNSTNPQTLQTCAEGARQRNFKYFGVEYSGECYQV